MRPLTGTNRVDCAPPALSSGIGTVCVFVWVVGGPGRPVGIVTGTGCVPPSAETAQDDTYVPLSRALLIYPSAEALKKPEVKAFVDFYLENVNAVAEQVGFIPLTDEQLKASEAATAKLQG